MKSAATPGATSSNPRDCRSPTARVEVCPSALADLQNVFVNGARHAKTIADELK